MFLNLFTSRFVHSQPLWQDHLRVSQSEAQPAPDFSSLAPQQANNTSASFVTPGNQSTSDQLPAPISPEYQNIGALEYQYLQSCAQHASWTPEELHAHALEQPDADAPARAADLAMWVWQLTADGQPRLQQQPQSRHH